VPDFQQVPIFSKDLSKAQQNKNPGLAGLPGSASWEGPEGVRLPGGVGKVGEDERDGSAGSGGGLSRKARGGPGGSDHCNDCSCPRPCLRTSERSMKVKMSAGIEIRCGYNNQQARAGAG